MRFEVKAESLYAFSCRQKETLTFPHFSKANTPRKLDYLYFCRYENIAVMLFVFPKQLRLAAVKLRRIP